MSMIPECKLLSVAERWLRSTAEAEPSVVATTCGTAATVDGAVLLELARRNRISPLLAIAPDGAIGCDLPAVCLQADQDYRAALLDGVARLSVGVGCCQSLERAGIPSAGLRGAFDAVRWYGDVALRPSADVDLLVPAAQRRDALRALELDGWRRRDRKPAWADAVNHYHWSLSRPGSAARCDLHWAMHHRYRMDAVDYAAVCRRTVRCDSPFGPWNGLAAEDALLLGFLRMERESADFWTWPDAEGLRERIRRGEMRPLLDAATILQREGARFDWAAMVGRAEAWQIADEAGVALTWVEHAFGVEAPAPFRDWAHSRCRHRASHGVTATNWWRTASRRPGWGGVVAKVALPYLWPDSTSFGANPGLPRTARRVCHVARAGARLTGGAAVAVAASIAAGCRPEWPSRKKYGNLDLAPGKTAKDAKKGSL